MIEKPYNMRVVSPNGSVQNFLADKLVLTDAGAARFYIDKVLVGAFKSDAWARIMVCAEGLGAGAGVEKSVEKKA